MDNRDRIVLIKICEVITEGQEFIVGKSKEDFLKDKLLQNAMCMIDIRIGELVKALSPAVRKENSDIPWRSIAGSRDIVAHKYGALDFEQVYETVTNNHPKLMENLQAILSDISEKNLEYYMSLKYSTVIETESDGTYVISYPDLQGCFSCGDTVDEAVKMGEDARKAWIENALKNNISIPEP